MNLGDIYLKVNKTKKACIKFKQAIEVNNNEKYAHFNLANALYECGNLRDSYISYRNVLRIDVENEEAWNNIYYCIKASKEQNGYKLKDLKNEVNSEYSLLLYQNLIYKLSIGNKQLNSNFKKIKRKINEYKFKELN